MSSRVVGLGIIHADGAWRAEEGKPLAEPALVMSFVSILSMWVNHHGLFGLVQCVSTGFLFANGFLGGLSPD
jgi:hypothetical protein